MQPKDVQEFIALRNEQAALRTGASGPGTEPLPGGLGGARGEQWQSSPASITDYHYYGTGDIGGAPDEESVKRLEAIVTQGQASLPPSSESGLLPRRGASGTGRTVQVGEAPST